MPAHKVEIVFITVIKPGCQNDPARALTRFDPGRTKINRVLPASQPAAVTYIIPDNLTLSVSKSVNL